MRQGLQLKLSQSLKMTPQLQQAIRLLQLSTLELRTEIQEALETNPLLETEEEAAATEAAEASESVDMDRGDDQLPEDLPVDSAWDDVFEGATPLSAPDPEAANRDILDFQSGSAEDLHDHLYSQLYLTPLGEVDRTIATHIIESLDEAGYLAEDLEAIEASLAEQFPEPERPGREEIEAVLHLVQRFGPPGIAARDLPECLALQLAELPGDTPHLDLARRLLEHLEMLAAGDITRLKRKLRAREEAIGEAAALIRTLDPRPGARIAATTADYVIPDVFVRRREGRWVAELNSDIAPRLRVNPFYSSMVKRGDKSRENTYIRDQMQEARWFIKSLASRNETLLRVAGAIVEHQQAFFDYGEEAMKPLVLREIAEELEMHESTISRVTTQKYMHTPRGVLEFKYFFSSHVKTTDGGECSATAIRAMIRKLVDGEDPRKPLSDSRLAAILEERGIRVARRTVAKYREAMDIPSSTQRKRLA